jgi:hypothetical protein
MARSSRMPRQCRSTSTRHACCCCAEPMCGCPWADTTDGMTASENATIWKHRVTNLWNTVSSSADRSPRVPNRYRGFWFPIAPGRMCDTHLIPSSWSSSASLTPHTAYSDRIPHRDALLAFVESFAPYPSSSMHLAAAGTLDATVPQNLRPPRPVSNAA